MPTLAHEEALWARGLPRVAGVDEVGVGPLCGAVVAAAVVLPRGCAAFLAGVRDSKAVPTRREREELAARVRAAAVRVGVGAASPREIERLNVRGATLLAMRRALGRIGSYDHALVDGRPLPGLSPTSHSFLVKGDVTSLSIAAASLIAKTMRDRLMLLLGARYPGYGWEHNSGYPTSDHRRALRELGPTPHHRRTYFPLLQLRLLDDEPEGAKPPGARPRGAVGSGAREARAGRRRRPGGVS